MKNLVLCIRNQQEGSMHVRVWVGTSRMAGKGLFAAQPMNKGTRIMQYIGRRIPKAETADRFYQGNQYIFSFNDHYGWLHS
jgi:SET domain-containing protein